MERERTAGWFEPRVVAGAAKMLAAKGCGTTRPPHCAPPSPHGQRFPVLTEANRPTPPDAVPLSPVPTGASFAMPEQSRLDMRPGVVGARPTDHHPAAHIGTANTESSRSGLLPARDMGSPDRDQLGDIVVQGRQARIEGDEAALPQAGQARQVSVGDLHIDSHPSAAWACERALSG